MLADPEMMCHILRVLAEIAGAIISKLFCGLVCDADDPKMIRGCFRQTHFSASISANIFGICLWGKEKAIATPGISVLVSLSCEVIDVLPLNLVSLEAVPFTKLGADSIPKH